MPLSYQINVNKDHAQAVATWNLAVDMIDTELISNFSLKIGDQPMNTACSGGNKACKGSDSVNLPDPNADCTVEFAITTNKPDVRNGADILRGDKALDDVSFYS